jgi:hypothetical protein
MLKIDIYLLNVVNSNIWCGSSFMDDGHMFIYRLDLIVKEIYFIVWLLIQWFYR